MPHSEPKKLDTAKVIQAVQDTGVRVWLSLNTELLGKHRFFGSYAARKAFAELLGASLRDFDFGNISLSTTRFNDDFIPTIKALRELNPDRKR